MTSTTTVTHGDTVLIGENQITGRYLTVTTPDGSRTLIAAGRNYYEPCARCDRQAAAAGRINSYAHVLNGVCFSCNGAGVGRLVITGTEEEMTAKVSKLIRSAARAAAKREAAHAAKVEASAAKVAAWRAAHPDVVAAAALVEADLGSLLNSAGQWDASAAEIAHYAATERWGGFAVELVTSIDYVGREGLTEAQGAALIASVERTVAREAAAAARRAEARHAGDLGELVEVTGVVEAATWVDTRYGLTRLVVVRGTGEHAGVTVKAFGKSKAMAAAEKGAAATLAGTVKENELRDGVAQTLLGRAKLTLAG